MRPEDERKSSDCLARQFGRIALRSADIEAERRSSLKSRGALLASLACLASAGAGSAPPSADPLLSIYAKPQMFATLSDGRKLHVRCMGRGSPTVILTAGQGDWSLTWRRVQPAIARMTRVCAWDRAGAGFSDPSREPQDVRHTTRDLERLLAARSIRPPYILAGHSVGSFESLYFAFRHPGRVSGILLIDPSSPFQYRRFRAAAPDAGTVVEDADLEELATLENCVTAAKGRTFRANSAAWHDCVDTPPPDYPLDLRAAILRMERNVSAARTLVSLMSNFERSSAQLDAAKRSLGNMPLLVLTAGMGIVPPLENGSDGRIEAEWARMHQELSALSTAGQQRLVPGAGHFIHVERPELVVEALGRLIATSREAAKSAAPAS